MTATNPHLKPILIAGALGAAAVALGMFTLSHQQVASNAAAPVITRHTTTAATPVATTTAPAGTTAPAVTTTPAPKPKPPVSPWEKGALAAGLPKPVAAQFADHEVVVLTVFTSEDAVDVTAQQEAEAGAGLAGAGYAAVDVSTEGASGKLTRVFGVVPAPTTLVLVRPSFIEPYVRFDGFADRETVAQAAENADPTPAGPLARSAWAKKADALCTGVTRDLVALGPVKTTADLKAKTPKVQALVATFVADLKKVPPPTGRADDVARFVALEQQDLALAVQLADAAVKQDLVALATASAKEATVGKEANALAIDLGAPACASPF